MVFTTPTLERVPQRIALSTRIAGGQGGPILAAVVGEGVAGGGGQGGPILVAVVGEGG